MPVCSGRWVVGVVLLGAGLLLAGCSSRSLNRAPVEDRSASRTRPPAATVDSRTQAVKPVPGLENAGKPGYYAVKPGDTMIRIGLENGQNWRDIARWNQIENPNQIEVGQVLRVQPPVTESPTEVVARPITTARAQTQTVPPVGASSVSRPLAVTPPPPAAATAETPADEQIAWGWPVVGPILAGFDEVKNKGLDIGGAAGEPVLAAADGRVVYAGAGLRGYGNLIILKHSNTYLTAYAHNQALLVKEEQAVRKGQKIAEMGNTDADRIKLHFEVRRQGKPVDPVKYLPAR